MEWLLVVFLYTNNFSRMSPAAAGGAATITERLPDKQTCDDVGRKMFELETIGNNQFISKRWNCIEVPKREE